MLRDPLELLGELVGGHQFAQQLVVGVVVVVVEVSHHAVEGLLLGGLVGEVLLQLAVPRVVRVPVELVVVLDHLLRLLALVPRLTLGGVNRGCTLNLLQSHLQTLIFLHQTCLLYCL